MCIALCPKSALFPSLMLQCSFVAFFGNKYSIRLSFSLRYVSLCYWRLQLIKCIKGPMCAAITPQRCCLCLATSRCVLNFTLTRYVKTCSDSAHLCWRNSVIASKSFSRDQSFLSCIIHFLFVFELLLFFLSYVQF